MTVTAAGELKGVRADIDELAEHQQVSALEARRWAWIAGSGDWAAWDDTLDALDRALDATDYHHRNKLWMLEIAADRTAAAETDPPPTFEEGMGVW